MRCLRLKSMITIESFKTPKNITKTEQKKLSLNGLKLACIKQYKKLGMSIRKKDISITHKKSGQPEILLPYDFTPKCSASISHTNGLLVVAVGTNSTRVGIDVEYMRKFSRPFAKRFLNKKEQDSIRNLFPSDKNVGETLFWSFKEASLKAFGVGLHQNPLSLRLYSLSRNGSMVVGFIENSQLNQEIKLEGKILKNHVIALAHYENRLTNSNKRKRPSIQNNF